MQVASGIYAGQAIVRAPAKRSSRRVVFRPAPRARVILRGLKLGTSVTSGDGPRNLTIRGMRVVAANGKQLNVAAFAPTRNVVLRNLNAASFYLNGVRKFRVKGGDWGPCLSSGNHVVDLCSNSKIDRNPLNNNITIDGARFHDYRIVPGSGAHFECMFIAGGTNITVRNSRFSDCEFYNIFIQYHGSPFNGLRIENNRFYTPWNGQGVRNRVSGVTFSGRGYVWRDVLVRRNSFTTAIQPDDGDSGGWINFRIVRNIGQVHQGCGLNGVAFKRNVWRKARCSASDRRIPFGYVMGAGTLRPARVKAAVVRKIFVLAAKGRRPVGIARRLNRLGAPAPGDKWTGRSVRGILFNRAYRGGFYGARGTHRRVITRAAWRAAHARLRSSAVSFRQAGRTSCTGRSDARPGEVARELP